MPIPALLRGKAIVAIHAGTRASRSFNCKPGRISCSKRTTRRVSKLVLNPSFMPSGSTSPAAGGIEFHQTCAGTPPLPRIASAIATIRGATDPGRASTRMT